MLGVESDYIYIYMKMKSLNDFFLNDFIKIIKKNNENKKVSIFYSNYVCVWF